MVVMLSGGLLYLSEADTKTLLRALREVSVSGRRDDAVCIRRVLVNRDPLEVRAAIEELNWLFSKSG